MFTGIVEELGQIKNIAKRSSITLLSVKANKVLPETKIGDSIALNGTCLTVVGNQNEVLSFEVMQETLKTTNLGSFKIADKVNLERSLKVGGRLSGHFVTGHIDCVGIIRQKKQAQGNISFEISVPLQFMKYIVPKGSIAVDGISLTIAGKSSNSFRVQIIPHTMINTTLGFKGPSHKVNLEFDILAKGTANYCQVF